MRGAIAALPPTTRSGLALLGESVIVRRGRRRALARAGIELAIVRVELAAASIGAASSSCFCTELVLVHSAIAAAAHTPAPA